MAAITSTGLGSGLDVNSIVTQLVALERAPIDQLKTDASDLNTKLSSFGKIQSYLDTLRTTSRTLSDPALWQSAKGSSADTAVGVAVTSGASAGAYSVQVGTLAAAQMNASTAVATAATAIGQGTLHIDVGSWAADGSAFTAKSGSSTVDIAIGPGDDTLEKIRDKINASSTAPVRATIVTDASGARLVMQSKTTGVENGFRIQVDDDDAVNDDNSGLSRLAYDPANGAGVATRSQAGRNATATINGLAVTSASNTLANVVDGVTLTLSKVTTSPVDVTVTRDTDAIKTAVSAFTSAYNDLVNNIRGQTKYDAASKTAGALQGDSTAINILNQVRSSMGLGSSASSAFGRLSDIGMQLQSDGTIKTTSTKLDSAVANLDELKKFFATAGSTAATSGLSERVRKLTDQLLGTDGAVTSRQEGLRKLVSLNSDRQAKMEDRVAATEKRLRAQYQALDTNMSRLNSLSNYVSQQITNWNKG